MLNFVLLLATIGQSPKPGDEATIYNDAGDRFSIPAFDSDSKLEEFVKLTECRDDKGLKRLMDSSSVTQLWPGTRVRCISGSARVEIRPDDGTSRGMQLFVLAKYLKVIDPKEEAARIKAEEALRVRQAEAERREAERARRAWEAARAARKLDPALVAKDIRNAISTAKAASFRKANAAIPKAELMRAEIERVRIRHYLEPQELLAIANAAGITVTFGGHSYDVLGTRLIK